MFIFLAVQSHNETKQSSMLACFSKYSLGGLSNLIYFFTKSEFSVLIFLDSVFYCLNCIFFLADFINEKACLIN